MADRGAAPDNSEEAFSEHGVQRRLGGLPLLLLSTLALTFSVYQLVVAAFHPLSSLVTRALHVGFLLALTFILYPAYKQHGAKLTRVSIIDAVLAVTAFGLSTYQWFFEGDLIQRAGDPTTLDLWVGAVMVVLVFEAARRILGVALPLVCGIFLLYGLFGQYLPGDLAHRGYAFSQIVDQLGFGTEGIFGIPTLVSATYIFLFILFGTFLEHAGMIQLFNAIALGLVGHSKGGPAKVAVISSGMMGTISGSGVANVLTVGQFTIPLMKRFGYSGVFAGAVEATASMGGQIMPPVMGAVAFIMAENLNVPYADIVKAAAVPAILYYVTAFWMVHLEAGRMKLLGLPKDQCPNPWRAMREQWYLLLPLVALVWMLFDGFTPMYSGMVGLALTAILILGATIAARLSSMAFRFVFWIAVGLASATLVKWGVYPVLAVIGTLILLSFAVKGGMKTLKQLRDSLIDGARQALPVGVACAIVGVIIGLSKMQGDSELVAIRAAGVGNLQITLPMLVLGTALSIFAFLVNLYGVPFAATAVRAIAMRAAILKLESPIEPGVFNTEVAGFTIYVKGGDGGNGRSRSDGRRFGELADWAGGGFVRCAIVGAMRPVQGGKDNCADDEQQQ